MRSEHALYDAAIESATIFKHAVREVAASSHLLDALVLPRTTADVVRVMGFLPERTENVRGLLRVLGSIGLLEQREHAGEAVYQVRDEALADLRTAPQGGRYRERADVLGDWFGEGHVEKIRASNKALLGHDLDFFRRKEAAIRFDRQYEQGWRTNLENPLYEFGRLLCVRELVQHGHRFLDLACGLGYGAMRLAEFVRGPCRIVGVDKSADFLARARANPYPDAEVTFTQRDLNTGLPPSPPASFDGVLFNGAFHFIADKPARLREIWRALRPGGALAIGHCFSHSGFADETMHDFYFSLLSDRAYVLPWSGVKEAVAEVGFEIFKEFHRGSHSYLIARRPAETVGEPPPASLSGQVPEQRGGLA